jgi:hypothetical protein
MLITTAPPMTIMSLEDEHSQNSIDSEQAGDALQDDGPAKKKIRREFRVDHRVSSFDVESFLRAKFPSIMLMTDEGGSFSSDTAADSSPASSQDLLRRLRSKLCASRRDSCLMCGIAPRNQPSLSVSGEILARALNVLEGTPRPLHINRHRVDAHLERSHKIITPSSSSVEFGLLHRSSSPRKADQKVFNASGA